MLWVVTRRPSDPTEVVAILNEEDTDLTKNKVTKPSKKLVFNGYFTIDDRDDWCSWVEKHGRKQGILFWSL